MGFSRKRFFKTKGSRTPATLIGVCSVCFMIGSQACIKSSGRINQNSSSHYGHSSDKKTSREVEAQLLQTIKTAESLGRGNPLLLSSLYSLAMFYREQGQFHKAETQYKRALAIKENLNGPDHADLVIILKNYAALLRDANRQNEADSVLARAKAIMDKHQPLPHSSHH